MPYVEGKILKKQVWVDNLVTQTFYKVKEGVIDQVFRATPFWDKLIDSGKIREKVPDGTHFEIPVRYAKANQNIKYIGRGTSMGREDKETLTRLFYGTSVIADSMIRYWDDERRNRGKAKLIDYVNDMVENHTESLRDALAEDSLTQNADPKAINALPTLFPTDPTTGTIGKLNRALNPWLRNETMDFSGLTTKANLLDRMETMYNKCSMLRGKGSRKTPDLILTTREIYQDYVQLAKMMGTFQFNTVTSRVDFGTGEAAFKGAEMFWDENCPSGCMFFLNLSTISFEYDPENWFEMTEWKYIPDSLDRVAQIVAVGNLICNNFQKNGVIHSITAVSI
jgi:hypothetical protein